ncbi:hypothetical protein scyTo_0020203 [Scyliorhinus torazame]|uniref:TLC domain-containing protein n=1 Tax=Scyliorhinus torazame TaxID=75743 RepID=A0A401Q240_SCYTO|nr:hypothetical protein [Scyliorhinus torazame]
MLPYFANFRLVAEFSTPFVNQRWFFEALGYPKTSMPNIINGFLMMMVFFLVRIAVMPPYYSKMISTFGTEAFDKLGLRAQFAWIAASICLDVMNIMWMYKIGRGCYKVLTACKKQWADIRENGKQRNSKWKPSNCMLVTSNSPLSTVLGLHYLLWNTL